jgi:hypothetical protein
MSERFKFGKVSALDLEELKGKSPEEQSALVNERPDLIIIHNLCGVMERLEALLAFFKMTYDEAHNPQRVVVPRVTGIVKK